MIKIIFSLLIQSAFATTPVQNILDPGAIDRKIDPCQNFYQYSCGSWLKEFKLPADKASYWRQGNVLSDHVEESLNTLLLKLSENQKATGTQAKLGT